jgi:hypothetical protein
MKVEREVMSGQKPVQVVDADEPGGAFVSREEPWSE